MNARRIFAVVIVGCAAAAYSEVGLSQSSALQVATNGIDSSTCGIPQRPCRSIGQAITNASVGATVVVGPGRYGDLNENGVFGDEPGEEAAPAGCGCVVLVDKRVRLVSRDGPSVTIVDANDAFISAVLITANDVAFGIPFNGFTLTHARLDAALLVRGDRVSIRGNIASFSGEGFAVAGSNGRLIGNLAHDNQGHGFEINGSGSFVAYNVATRNPAAAPELRFTVAGFHLRGAGHELRANIVSDNDFGIVVGAGASDLLINNSVIGNRFAGFFIEAPQDERLVIRRNNIFDNARRSIDQPNSGSLNCGFFNGGGTLVRATDNFWGAEGGPGNVFADHVCGPSPVISEPFARREFSVPNDFRLN